MKKFRLKFVTRAEVVMVQVQMHSSNGEWFSLFENPFSDIITFGELSNDEKEQLHSSFEKLFN